jgi:hypothetical protein
MPAPQATMMQTLAKTQFTSFAIKLPVDWKQPQGKAGDQYAKAFKASEHVGTLTPPTLFMPASMNKYHTDTVDEISHKFATFIDGICSAICSAWSQWQATAVLSGVLIAGPVATGGQVAGIPWQPIILAMGPKATPNELKYTQVVASVLGQAWLAYTATIKVPGLPFYPMFAAFPSPAAPPTPNVPFPVAALTQVTVPISKMLLKQQMIAMLADPGAPHHAELFDSIADAFEKCFQQWQLSTMVNNVLGMGAVPSMSLPIPVPGPVVAGVGTMTPGGFT